MTHLLSRLNPVPAFPPYLGPYSVGTTDIEIQSPPSTGNESHTGELLTPPDAEVNTIAYRLFYPCKTPKTTTRPVTWVPYPQHKTQAGYIKFIGGSPYIANIVSYLAEILYHIKIPAYQDVPLLPNPTSSGKWPLVIFSHGMGGSRQAYSYLCGSLASQGMVVAAADHRDGSKANAFIASTGGSNDEYKIAREVDFRDISFNPNPETFEARDEQLSIRFWELTCILESLVKLNAGSKQRNLLARRDRPSFPTSHDNTKIDTADLSPDPLLTFASSIDLSPGRVTLAGHSFGATTALIFQKRCFYSDPSSPQGASLGGTLWSPPSSSTAVRLFAAPDSPLVLLDLWALPLESDANAALHSETLPWYSSSSSSLTDNKTNVPKPTSPTAPVIAILSQAFAYWSSNLSTFCSALCPPPEPANRPSTTTHTLPLVFYAAKSAHFSQSDFGLLFPRITKWFAKAEEPRRVLSLNVRAITEMLRRRGILPRPAEGSSTVPPGENETEQESDDDNDDNEEEDEDGFTLLSSPSETLARAQRDSHDNEGDWRILDTTRRERIRNWINVPVIDERAAGPSAPVPSSVAPPAAASAAESGLGFDGPARADGTQGDGSVVMGLAGVGAVERGESTDVPSG